MYWVFAKGVNTHPNLWPSLNNHKQRADANEKERLSYLGCKPENYIKVKFAYTLLQSLQGLCKALNVNLKTVSVTRCRTKLALASKANVHFIYSVGK